MRINKKDNQNNFYTVEVTLEPEELLRAKNMAYLKNRQITYSTVNPGRRFSMQKIEQNTKPGYFNEVAVKSLEDSIINNVKEFVGEEVAAGPRILGVVTDDDGNVTVNVSYFKDSPVVSSEFAPIDREMPDVTVSKKDLRKALDQKRTENIRLIPKDEPAKKGDIVNVDVVLNLDGEYKETLQENLNLTVGDNENSPIEDLDLTALIKATEGNSYILDKRGGDRIDVVAKVNQVYKAELPKLDDDFASEISEYDTLKEYRSALKEEIEAETRDNYATLTAQDSLTTYLINAFDKIEDFKGINLLDDEVAQMFNMSLQEALSNMSLVSGIFGAAFSELVLEYNRAMFKKAIDDLFEEEGLETSEEEIKELKRILENPVSVHEKFFGFKPFEICRFINNSEYQIYNLASDLETALKTIKLLGSLKERISK